MTRIFFLCPDEKMPSGGVKKIYQHVDILNEAGICAYVLHQQVGFSCNWFDHQTPLAYMPLPLTNKIAYFFKKAGPSPYFDLNCPLIGSLKEKKDLGLIHPTDIIVVPEYCLYSVHPYLKNQPFVIFNQGAYLTFRGIQLPKEGFFSEGKTEAAFPYFSPNLLGALVVSEDSLEYLNYVFPHLYTQRIHLSIDFTLFSFQKFKEKQLVYMPRRCAHDVVQVMTLLRERGRLKNWFFNPIDDKNEVETAKLLRNAALFLSFAFQEGFSLPLLEAMACGCIAIGYHGEGALEFFNSFSGYPVENSAIITYVKTVEKVALDYELRPDFYLNQAQDISTKLKEKYSVAQEKKDVIDCWASLLEKNASKNTH